MKKAPLIVYGDFNCPCSYALSEILLDADLSATFEWRTIEHLPGVSAENFTFEAQSLLATEVYNVRHLAPDLCIVIPPCRPNTALANRLLFIVSQRTPEKTALLRRQIYRALWVEGRDISSVDVLLDLLPGIDLDGTIDLDELQLDNSLLQSWQRGWDIEKYQGRTPILIDHDRQLAGLASLSDIQRFIAGEQLAEDIVFSCYVKPRQRIAIVGELQPLRQFVEILGHQYHLDFLRSHAMLWELVRADQAPDLVLIDTDPAHAQSLTLCESLQNDVLTRPIPLMLVADHFSIDEEVHAYRIGVRDYIKRDRSPEVFKARVDMLLQLKARRDELDKAARIDSLTQIYNRREFDRGLAQEWHRCARSKSPLSLLMIDIDRFKYYNDHYGHLAGDGCLRMLAQSMKDSVDRLSDLVSRYGGEEFAVLLPDTDAEGALKVAQHIQQRINALKIPHQTSDVTGHVTVSIGCFTLLPTPNGDMLALVAGADKCLYQAKNTGRNKIVGDC